MPSHESATFVPSTPNMAVEDLGFLRNGQRFRGNGRDAVPNRSGSAPPNMEGSFFAINNLISQQNSNLNPTLEDDNSKISLHLSQGVLSTHKEELEDDHSPKEPLESLANKTNGFWSGDDAAPLAGQSKRLVDIIQCKWESS
ncbi:hypothetical protein D5086_005975 [Populus alba]|uniref:Uncharacterized protein n=1 Tax=Populus alba TaxID=43335 RepID=A0ACC4CKB7_POPAL